MPTLNPVRRVLCSGPIRTNLGKHPMRHARSALALSASLAAGLSSSALAQDLGVKAPPQSHPIYLVGGTVHTVSGDVIESGAVGFDNGTITFVGSADDLSAMRLAEGTELIDTSGKHVFPGMVLVGTRIGLVEISAVPQSRDDRELGQFKPEVYAASAVNPDSTVIPVTRSNGVLTFGTFPVGGRIPGRASVLRADGWTRDDMAIDPAAGLVISWPRVGESYSAFGSGSGRSGRFGGGGGGDSGEQIDELTDYFDAADAYLATKSLNPKHPTDIGFEAMAPMLPGAGDAQKPVFINASGYDQIVSAVNWAVGRGLKPVIVGGTDALLAADLLKSNDVPVVLSGAYPFPKRSDSPHDDRYTLPIRLDEAGIRFALKYSDDDAHSRNLPYEAGRAVGYGMDPEAALKSVTLAAAQILGVGDKLGSIETGKFATLFVSDGHCLDIMSNVEIAFVDGRQIDLDNKQTHLRDKYRAKYKQLGLIQDD
ncbi:MAG: imidazolonepropionase-like amidohydrolase [Phycisphaerales bacterium]|jgi:imidazolonepropionase-like amidohydrolase